MKWSSAHLLCLILNASFITLAQAHVPVWTFTPNPAFSPKVSLDATQTATVQYTVTNQSSKIHTLQMKPIAGITASGCASPLPAHQSCILTLTINGNALRGTISGGPVLCEHANPLQCYQPGQSDSLAVRFKPLVPNVNNMSLSINCLPGSACTSTQNAALTGNPRTIVFANVTSVPVTNIALTSSALPSGTTITNNTCIGNLPPGSSCFVTLTPGNSASLDANNQPCTTGTAPEKGLIKLTSDNGMSTAAVYVLGYGCQYQGGYLFSIDDTTVYNQSMGGKVASLVNQAGPAPELSVSNPNGVVWSPITTPTVAILYVGTNVIGLAAPTPPPPNAPVPTQPPVPAYPAGTPSLTPCTSARADGTCNTQNIVAYYQYNNTASLSSYAAGLCQVPQGIAGYNDWYLPAICELGRHLGNPGSFNAGCEANLQNMQDNLAFLITPTPAAGCNTNEKCLSGIYWSSTAFYATAAPTAQANAWFQFFIPDASRMAAGPKRFTDGVRCVRALTKN